MKQHVHNQLYGNTRSHQTGGILPLINKLLTSYTYAGISPIIPATLIMLSATGLLYALLFGQHTPLSISDLLGTAFFAFAASIGVARRYSNTKALASGVCTAIGGGTTRNLVAMSLPGWAGDMQFLLVAILVAALGVLVAPKVREGSALDKLVDALDRTGLGVFATTGPLAVKGFALSVSEPVLLVLMVMGGVVTCVGGGFLRDILITKRQRPVALYTFYGVSALAGSIFFVVLHNLEIPGDVVITILFTAVFAQMTRNLQLFRSAPEVRV